MAIHSKNEPFGLSTLESMAAGLAILIPADGAYWDRQLQDRQDCLKYRADDPTDLALKILYLKQNPEVVCALGRAAQLRASEYRSDRVYRQVIDSLTSSELCESSPAGDDGQAPDHA